MVKYKVCRNDITPEDAASLIGAVARYASVNEYPNVRDILAILGIVRNETVGESEDE